MAPNKQSSLNDGATAVCAKIVILPDFKGVHFHLLCQLSLLIEAHVSKQRRSSFSSYLKANKCYISLRIRVRKKAVHAGEKDFSVETWMNN